MANMGGFSVAGMKKLQKQLNKIQQGNVEAFIDACAKELAARLLAKVIKHTPVRQYPANSGKKGGTLRRGWTSKTHKEAENGSGTPNAAMAAAYAESLQINHIGKMLQIEIINPVEYASYVEYGHRQEPGRYVPELGKRLKKGWVQGQFMLTVSEQEIQDIAPKVLTSKIKKFLEECMK